jgi:hypothetical protein
MTQGQPDFDGQRFIAVLQAQRNAALDTVAQCEARIASLVARISELERQLAGPAAEEQKTNPRTRR